MDTSCPIFFEAIVDPCSHVLIEIKSLFQKVMLILTVHYSTTLRPAAMVWLALLMIPRKSLHVLFAQSEVNLNHATLDSAVYIIIVDWIAIMY